MANNFLKDTPSDEGTKYSSVGTCDFCLLHLMHQTTPEEKATGRGPEAKKEEEQEWENTYQSRDMS